MKIRMQFGISFHIRYQVHVLEASVQCFIIIFTEKRNFRKNARFSVKLRTKMANFCIENATFLVNYFIKFSQFYDII